MKIAVFVLCAALLLPANVAGATTVPDTQDVRGKLDLRAASLDKVVVAESGVVHLRIRWTTYETWTVRECHKAQAVPGGCRVEARLDTRGRAASRGTGHGMDYLVEWGPLSCSVKDAATDAVVVRGTSYKGPRKAACTFRRGPLVIKKPIRWYAFTKWATSVYKGRYATDYAPQSGWASGSG